MPEEPEFIARLASLSDSRNLAEEMSDGALASLANLVLEEYRIDYNSMSEWRERSKKGLDLASMVRGDRQKPFESASDVIYPLVTSAALQFNARAYPAIVPSDSPVLPKVHGDDPSGQKAARAQRIAEHMGWQLRHQVKEWEGETDALLTVLPIVGTMVRKVWYDQARGRLRVKLCDHDAIVINDKAKSLELAPRISEILKLYPYEIQERKLSGTFRDVEISMDSEEDRDGPQEFIEQHRRIDLDGDGYPEPYVVTVHKASQQVVRVVANYTMEDIKSDGERVLSIDRRDHFVVYTFLPSMSGGFWGTGLGMLLGDISHTINTVINQLIDAGALNNLGGGFIGAQNFRLRGGESRFKPGEWKQVPAMGADIRQGIVPLPQVQPSMVLFNMLGLLIDAGREIASVKDVITGDNKQNMTATTTLALIEQGQMVFTAAYKRIYKALRDEYGLIAEINAETVSDQEYSRFHDMVVDGQPVMLSAAREYDLRDMDISPTADPRSVTVMQSMARAQFLMEAAQGGTVDPEVAMRRALEAAQIEDVEELVPEVDQLQVQLAARQAKHADMMMMLEAGLKEAEITLKMAQADKAKADAIKDMADAEGADEDRSLRVYEEQLATLRTMVKEHNETQRSRFRGMAGAPGNKGSDQGAGGSSGVPKINDLANALGGIGAPKGSPGENLSNGGSDFLL